MADDGRKTSFFKKLYTSPNWRVFSISISVVLFILIFLGCITYELSTNRQDVIDAYRNWQSDYVGLLAYDIEELYSEGSGQDAAVDFLGGHAISSGERFVVLTDGDTVVWAKDENTTATLGKYSATDSFWRMIEQQDVVIDSADISADGHELTVSMVTDEDMILEDATLTQHDYYIILATGIVSVVLVSLLITLLGFWNRTEKNLNGTKHELHLRNRKLEEITWADGAFDNTAADSEGDDMLRKASAASGSESRQTDGMSGDGARHTNGKVQQTGSAGGGVKALLSSSYRFKFYIDARHSIYINGHMGEIHPHTWEMIVQAVKTSDNFVRFDMVEKTVEKLIEPYQNNYLNELPPFDAINPTVENMSRFFGDKIHAALGEMGWSLVMIEMSETPGRSYVLTMEDDTKAGGC